MYGEACETSPTTEVGQLRLLHPEKGPAKDVLPQELLMQIYTSVSESVLCSSITFWFGAATKQGRNRL